MRFTRNRIRKELLPLLAKEYNHAITDALLQLGELARDSQVLIDANVGEVTAKCVHKQSAAEVVLNLSILAAEPRHLVREVLIEVWRTQGWPMAGMGHAEWESLADMVLLHAKTSASERQKRQFPGAVFAELHDRELRLTATDL